MAPSADPYPFVYHDGFRANIKSHKPPPPFGHRLYKANQPSIRPPQPAQTESQLNYVFLHSPMQTEPVKHPQEAVLTVVKQLTNSKSDGARVFGCKVSPKFEGVKGDLVFAKIYDPLYYSYALNGFVDVRNPVVSAADRDYSREAAAYEFMRDTGHDGGFAPAYYGSWTFMAPPYKGRTRAVRLIITEYIPAPSLYQEHYQHYTPHKFRREKTPPNERADLPDKFRLRILASALALRSRQLQFGLSQGDFAPRNLIVLLGGRKEDELDKRPIQRIVLVDYNKSIVYPRSDREFSPQEQPKNPLEVYWNNEIYEFEDWAPKIWDDNPDRRREWLYTTFGHSQQYRPIAQSIQAEVELFLKSSGRMRAA